jgi:hypothetical protein
MPWRACESQWSVDISGRPFDITVSKAAGIGSGDSASSSIVSRVAKVTINDGYFKIAGTDGAGVGAGSVTGAGTVDTLQISGGRLC